MLLSVIPKGVTSRCPARWTKTQSKDGGTKQTAATEWCRYTQNTNEEAGRRQANKKRSPLEGSSHTSGAAHIQSRLPSEDPETWSIGARATAGTGASGKAASAWGTGTGTDPVGLSLGERYGNWLRGLTLGDPQNNRPNGRKHKARIREPNKHNTSLNRQGREHKTGYIYGIVTQNT